MKHIFLNSKFNLYKIFNFSLLTRKNLKTDFTIALDVIKSGKLEGNQMKIQSFLNKYNLENWDEFKYCRTNNVFFLKNCIYYSSKSRSNELKIIKILSLLYIENKHNSELILKSLIFLLSNYKELDLSEKAEINNFINLCSKEIEFSYENIESLQKLFNNIN